MTLSTTNLNPVDWFNHFGSWDTVFESKPSITIDNNTVLQRKTPIFRIDGIYAEAIDGSSNAFEVGKRYTKFTLLSIIRFDTNYRQAYSWVEYTLMGRQCNYIRVGTDYFRVTNKTDQYGIKRQTIKAWKKEEIRQDHGKDILNIIPRYDDFCIVPNNKSHEPIVDNCYNLYAAFSHKPRKGDITHTLNFMRHIFGDQIDLGMTYIQCLYQLPQQILPILCMVSSERETGKTTFINWIQMIFGDNFIRINPEDLSSQFNSAYSTKNIIAIDETVIDKSSAVEKLKSLTTAKSISVNQKHVANYELPFYGKVIINSNKVHDFMRIDEEEIRFWVRKINTINKINTNMEEDLRKEIPAFLYHLDTLPLVNTSNSRMVFTDDQIQTEALINIKSESRSGLYKDLNILIANWFDGNALHEAYATAIDIKEMWFRNNSAISVHYIRKVLKEEFKIHPEPNQRYNLMYGTSYTTATGTPYKFLRKDFTNDPIPEQIEEEEPF